jgi:hypothetical protein
VVEKQIRTGDNDPAQSPNIVARLLHLSPISPALRKKRDALVAYLLPLMDQAKELEQELLEYRQRTLEASLVEHRAKCRKQKGLVDSLREKLQTAELRLLNAMGESQNQIKILKGFRDLKASGKHVPAWPTAAEVDAFEISYAAQQDKVVRANERVNTALTSRNELLFRLEPEDKNMEALIAAEARLKFQVTKQPFIDLELGLEVIPSGYVND